MSQETFEIEECVQEKNKRKGDMNMLRKAKRTLSLVLALIMLCSTMGVMAFAAVNTYPFCPECDDTVRDYYLVEQSRSFDRIIVCPTHDTHDAEVWRVYYKAFCSIHRIEVVDGNPNELYKDIYICLD